MTNTHTSPNAQRGWSLLRAARWLANGPDAERCDARGTAKFETGSLPRERAN